MRTWGVGTHEQLVLAANVTPARDFAGLFPEVLRAADAGDALACDVLARAGTELAGLAKIVIRKLFANAGPARLAMAGGVFAVARCSAKFSTIVFIPSIRALPSTPP